jgi:archaetidylinositol phosphate synthase
MVDVRDLSTLINCLNLSLEGYRSLLMKLKRKVDGALGAVARGLLRLGFTPNTLTVISLCLSIVAAYLYAQPAAFWYVWIAAIILFFSGFCDALDGAIARVGRRVTPFGGFLDSVVDRYSDAAVILGITLSNVHGSVLGISNLLWGLLALIGAISVSYARAKAESLGIEMATIGLAERPERILILIVTSIILRPDFGLVAIAILANITVVQRGIHVYRKTKTRDVHRTLRV